MRNRTHAHLENAYAAMGCIRLQLSRWGRACAHRHRYTYVDDIILTADTVGVCRWCFLAHTAAMVHGWAEQMKRINKESEKIDTLSEKATKVSPA